MGGVAAAEAQVPSYDVLVYGATPSGIMAAIGASRVGARVLLLEQTRHVGGLNTSGLNRSETEHMEREATFGGLCATFFGRIVRRYPMDGKVYTWESKFAEEVLLDLLGKAGVAIRYGAWLASVVKERGRIRAITLENGDSFGASVFIDASYEGDLMAAAGVPYTIGREAAAKYGESRGGVRLDDKPVPVSPFDGEGLLPGVSEGSPGAAESADHRFVCYNVRMNLSNDPANRLPIPEPRNYDARQHELLARCLTKGVVTKLNEVLGWYALPNGKVELNNSQNAIVSLGMPGAQFGWPNGNREERQRIHQAHRDYAHGVLWFLLKDPRVPAEMRSTLIDYGLCRDEWEDNGHWPYYLYVREARRMVGEMVLTERDLTERREKTDSICLGSHYIDAHTVDRFAVGKDSFVNEGRLWLKGKVFQIPWLSIMPRAIHCENLLVPVCLSASHVAFLGIRVEPTWMKLGESAGVAAAIVADKGKAVQELDPLILQAKLRRVGQIVDMPKQFA